MAYSSSSAAARLLANSRVEDDKARSLRELLARSRTHVAFVLPVGSRRPALGRDGVETETVVDIPKTHGTRYRPTYDCADCIGLRHPRPPGRSSGDAGRGGGGGWVWGCGPCGPLRHPARPGTLAVARLISTLSQKKSPRLTSVNRRAILRSVSAGCHASRVHR